MKKKKSDPQRILKRIQKAVAELLDKEGDDITWYLAVRHDPSGLTVHTGAGCAVCMVGRSIQWLIENDIRHIDGKGGLGVIAVQVPNTDDEETKH